MKASLTLILCGAVSLLATTSPVVASGADDGNAGMNALKRGEYDLAIRLFTRALGSRSLSADDREFAYGQRGEAYLRKGDYPAAIADLQRAVHLKPDDADAVSDLALARSGQGGPGRPGPARRDTAAEATADANAGMAAFSRRDYVQAIQMFSRALDSGTLGADDTELAYLSRGKAYLQRRDYPHSVSDLSRALQLNAGDQEARAALGESLIRLRAANPETPIDGATCVAAVTEKGNFLTGRIFAGFAVYANTPPTDAFAGAFTFLINEKWNITRFDLHQGVISAIQQTAGVPASANIDVRVEPATLGSKTSITMKVGSLLIVHDAKGYVCRMLAEAPTG